MKFSLAMDRNGNKILRVHPSTGRGFSIQTNGNLPKTHRNGIGDWTQGEVAAYVVAFGTSRQQALID